MIAACSGTVTFISLALALTKLWLSPRIHIYYMYFQNAGVFGVVFRAIDPQWKEVDSAGSVFLCEPLLTSR